MPDTYINTRFPDGLRMLQATLRREGVPVKKVEIQLLYHSWSWALKVMCPAVSYVTVRQLPPEDLRADTAFSELCDSIAEELSDLFRAAPQGS